MLRRWVFGVFALVGGLATVAVLAGLWLTRTEAGRARVVSWVTSAANGVFDGRATLTIGRVASLLPSNLVLEDVALRDSAGVPVLSARHVQGALSVRDLRRGLVRIPRLALDSVRLDLRQDSVGPFNLQWVIRGDTTRVQPPGPPGLGDDVRIEALTLRHAVIEARYPWAPHPLFTTAAERDSVTALRDSLHDIARVGSGYIETRRITIPALFARDLIAITPTDAPGSLVIDSAQLGVSDPPVSVRGVRGTVQWYDDSLTFAAPEVRLPASRLQARGVIAWGLPGPVRYDVAIDAPDVALDDINWTWPVMPREGRARATVRLRTLDNPDHLEVALRDLEATAMSSQITGELTMVAEVRDFLLRDVALAFSPLTTSLANQLTENVLPPEIEGRFEGRFVARDGGSLDSLRIDTLRFVFDDARAPGAQSHLRAEGTVAIGPAPRARDVRIQEFALDLRSAQPLVAEWPTGLGGMLTASGLVRRASLDAADLQDLLVQWTDPAGRATTVRGQLAAQWSGGPRRVAMALQVDTLPLAALAVLDTALPARGVLGGTISADGALDSLPFSVRVQQLLTPSGALRADGTLALGSLDADSVRWQLAARVQADSLDVAPWALAGVAPSTRLVGAVQVNAAGRAAALDTARLDIALQQPASAQHTPFSLFALGTWGRDAMLVDSLVAEAPGAHFDASGGLARDSLGRESFRGNLRMDSLRVVRRELPRLARMIATVDTALATSVRTLAEDTLSGDLNASIYGEGSFARYLVSVAVAGQQVRVGDVATGRIFGSVRADDLPRRARFVAAATVDSIEGIAAVRIATANFGVDDATPERGALRFDLLARDTSRLRLRGAFARGDDTLVVGLDTVQFTYGDVAWTNDAPLNLRDRPTGFAIDSFALRSNRGGSLRLGADAPLDAPINAFLRLDAFPAGELAAFALGTARLPGLVSGALEISGRRDDPTMRARFVADSLGTMNATLSGVRIEADYAAERLDARLALADTLGRTLRGEVTLPADLRLQSVVGDRFYTEALNGAIVADSLRLRALPFRLATVRDLDGLVHGRIALGGTFDNPDITGRIQLEQGTLYSETLGIRPTDAALHFVAGGDSLSIARFRFRSGARAADTLHLSATVRRPLRDNPRVSLSAYLNNVALARQRDGTDLDLSGRASLSGQARRPVLTADLFVPHANLVLDLTESRTVLDLQSAEAQALLTPDEQRAAAGEASTFAGLGEFLEARGVRVRLGDDVWVRTREASVKLGGEVTVLEAAGQQLSLDGEVQAERGTYRLDLGVVNRPFTVDSGRVRFYPQDALNPTLDIHARHVVRGVDGRDVNVDVAIGGTLEAPSLKLASTDDSYANAPESEFISLLVFGAPTFALDGQSQQTVRAVTGVLLPSLSGQVEGTLQRLLPVFNTVQVSTAGGQSGDDLGTFSSLLNNLSVTAGKQIGRRTYLRLDTGVCRGLASGASRNALNLWYGIATEYRFAPGLTGQVGVDPGPSPCGARLGGAAPRMQVGFDLFKEWVF